MNWNEFLKRLRRHGRASNLVPKYIAHRGKSRHGTIYLGERRVTVRDRRNIIGQGLLAAMLADLGIDPAEF